MKRARIAALDPNRSCLRGCRQASGNCRLLSIEGLESRRLLAGDGIQWPAVDRAAEGSQELVEILLQPRTDDDQPISPEPDGSYNVAINEPFDLEVSYNDLRSFDDRLGLFQLHADLLFSHQNVLEPVLTEAQRFVISRDFTHQTQGSFEFSMQGSPVTYQSNVIAFRMDSRQEFVNAMSTFGYEPGEYTLRSSNSSQKSTFEIHFVGDEFIDVDVPDIMISSRFAEPINVTMEEFAPRNPDGSINGKAVRYNIDSLSRTFENNDHFFSNLYAGDFDPGVGFIRVGGTGQVPTVGGGVPQVSSDGSFITPFDAFSLRVRPIALVNDFSVRVVPNEFVEAVLAYGRDNPLRPDQVLIDDDAIIHLNVIGGNQSPVVAAPVTAIVHVDQSSQMLDLLESAEDPDGDALHVSNPRIDGDTSGVRIEGRMLTVLPGAYDRLFAGEEMVVNVTYDVLDSAGGRAEATARITLVGVAGAVNPLPFRHRRLDVSGDLRITALDALQVFNSIARQSLAKSGVSDALSSIDTNNDGVATAADALKIINYLNRQEARESLNLLREEVAVLWNADDPTDVSEASADLPLDSSVGLF